MWEGHPESHVFYQLICQLKESTSFLIILAKVPTFTLIPIFWLKLLCYFLMKWQYRGTILIPKVGGSTGKTHDRKKKCWLVKQNRIKQTKLQKARTNQNKTDINSLPNAETSVCLTHFIDEWTKIKKVSQEIFKKCKVHWN